MKITKLASQIKRTDRYSVFIDGKYSFSLSQRALLASQIYQGQELSKQQIDTFMALSSDDKFYNLALRYLAIRPRSVWEVHSYLERKRASPPLIKSILNKLTKFDLIDDQKFANAFVADRQLLRPTSRRKLQLELRKKHLSNYIIEQATSTQTADDQLALQATITSKRRQTKYQDDLKLMQYLARQGFNYQDIRAALHKDDI